MKIGIISDIHYEHYMSVQGAEVNEFLDMYRNKVDCMIYAGDIISLDNFKEFCKKINSTFKHNLVILGNHDLWDITSTLQQQVVEYRNIAEMYDNIEVLFNNMTSIDGYWFIGSTLFSSLTTKTEMDKLSRLDESQLSRYFNDFIYTRYLSDDYERVLFLPQDMIKEYWKSRKYIEESLNIEKIKKAVVITHFSPSRLSIAKKYKKSFDNFYFCNDDTEFIKKYTDKIPLWIHGHTHTPFDYTINKTRVVCNPVGYPGENETFKPIIIDL